MSLWGHRRKQRAEREARLDRMLDRFEQQADQLHEIVVRLSKESEVFHLRRQEQIRRSA